MEEVGYPSADATPPTVTTPTLHRLVSVNEFIQLFVHLSRASQAMYNLRRENVSNTHHDTSVQYCCVVKWWILHGRALYVGRILEDTA